MSQESQIPQQLITAAMLVFESGVPISDCNLQNRVLRDRLARVQHVYWQWMKKPYLEDQEIFELFRNMMRDNSADRHSLYRMANRDLQLFRFVKEHVALSSRKQDEALVRTAAKHAIKIGLDTDNVNALTKGGKLLYEVAGLDKPESEQADMSKVMFLPPVVTTQVTDVDPNKTPVTDEQALAIINKYNAHQDSKRLAIDERVNTMIAKRDAEAMATEIIDESEDGNE